MKRKALGKGLDALLPSLPEEGTPAAVDVDLIFPNPRQPRMRFSADSLEELAASIRENGIVQPIVVRRRGERYEIIAGERRWRAAQQAGLLKVPAVVMEVPDERMLELALLENIQRENLNPIEEARAYQMLLEDQGLKQEELSRRLGKARTTITNSLRLLLLPPKVHELLENSTLTPGQARPLLSLPDRASQSRLAEIIVRRGLSAREVERLVGRLQRADKKRGSGKPKDANVMAAEEKLCHRLATRVRIVPAKRGGQIVIHYDSAEELERLFESLCQVR